MVKAQDFDSCITWVQIPPAQLDSFFIRLFLPPTATAVIKGTSNVLGGFVRLLLEDVKQNRAACRLAVRRYDSQKPHSAESSTINTAETGETPLWRFSSVG